MQWDLGPLGFGVLLVMSLGFGVIAQLVMGRVTTRWLWAVAATTYFLAGLFISEVWFGWATEAELQPNVDGLPFDEVLLIGPVAGILVVFLTWYVTRRSRHDRPLSP
jgi:sterol desaturase/sphingolipid hydroxylase (fatty acid hydroxylase superfamily)